MRNFTKISFIKLQCTDKLRVFVQKFNSKYNMWHSEFDLNYLWSQESIEKVFSVPYLTSNDCQKVMQMFETCMNTTISGRN